VVHFSTNYPNILDHPFFHFDAETRIPTKQSGMMRFWGQAPFSTVNGCQDHLYIIDREISAADWDKL